MKTLRLPDWVVCPECKGALKEASIPPQTELQCRECRKTYQVRRGVPLLLDNAGLKACEDELSHHAHPTQVYHDARHQTPCTMEYLDYWCGRQLELLPQKKFSRTVEIMAGGAELSRRAVGISKPIIALDLNYELLSLSRDEVLPEIVPIGGSAFRLPFKDNSLDLILVQGGLHHVRRQVADAIREIARCLAPGGVLMASEPRNDNLLLHAFRRVFYTLHPYHEQDVEDGFTHDQMRGFLEQAGLRLEIYEPFAYLGYMLIANTDLIPVFQGMSRNWFSRFLINLDRAWSRVPLARRLAWATFIRAVKPG